jgi:hypothetical protein
MQFPLGVKAISHLIQELEPLARRFRLKEFSDFVTKCTIELARMLILFCQLLEPEYVRIAGTTLAVYLTHSSFPPPQDYMRLAVIRFRAAAANNPFWEGRRPDADSSLPQKNFSIDPRIQSAPAAAVA